MTNVEFVVFSSDSFMPRTKVCLDSIKEFHPDSKIHLCKVEADSTSTYPVGMAKKRIEKLIELQQNNKDSAFVLLGADCVLYDSLYIIIQDLFKDNILITPHVLNPKSATGSIYRTGHINADIIITNRFSLPILKWLVKQDMKNLLNEGIFYEQTWLSSTPFLFSHVGIIKHPGINFAYFNIQERQLTKNKDNKYIVCFDEFNSSLKIAQFSGFDPNNPSMMSKYYSGEPATGDLLSLYEEYARKISS